MAGGALEGRDSRRPIQRRVGEGPGREVGNGRRGEAGESRRSGRAGARRARLPFWSRAAATAAGFGRKREEPVRWERGCHVGAVGGAEPARAGGEEGARPASLGGWGGGGEGHVAAPGARGGRQGGRSTRRFAGREGAFVGLGSAGGRPRRQMLNGGSGVSAG